MLRTEIEASMQETDQRVSSAILPPRPFRLTNHAFPAPFPAPFPARPARLPPRFPPRFSHRWRRTRGDGKGKKGEEKLLSIFALTIRRLDLLVMIIDF